MARHGHCFPIPGEEKMRTVFRVVLVVGLLVLFVGEPPVTAGPAKRSGMPAASSGGAELGRRVYLARCTACHNPDPSRDGRVGPAVKGAPLELVRTRVLWAAYPPGYAPKRGTRIMPPQPDLASRVRDLAAYLAR
jgi:mono/diheme cytochrome c family protein